MVEKMDEPQSNFVYSVFKLIKSDNLQNKEEICCLKQKIANISPFN